MLKTSTLLKFPEITSTDLLEAMQKVEAMGPFYSVLKCSPEAYIAIKDYFVQEEHEEMLHKAILEDIRKFTVIEKPREPINHWGTIYGIDIKLDPTLAPGEYRFE